MAELWGTLAPLVLANAVVPIQVIVTIVLLRSPAGKVTAVAWVAGTTAVRLLQGVLFGVVVGGAPSDSEAADDPRVIVATLLLVLGVLLASSAIKSWAGEPNADDTPPKWRTAIDAVTPKRAFVLGVVAMAAGVKFWVFTISALGAIAEAGLGPGAAVGNYLLYVALAQGVHIMLVVLAYAAPSQADRVLDSLYGFLERNSRVIGIVVGLVFGGWFMFKGLDGLGVL